MGGERVDKDVVNCWQMQQIKVVVEVERCEYMKGRGEGKVGTWQDLREHRMLILDVAREVKHRARSSSSRPPPALIDLNFQSNRTLLCAIAKLIH